MQKKGLLTILICFIIVALVFYINSTSIFLSFKGKREVYIGSNSSNAKIISVEDGAIGKYLTKKGESVFIENERLDVAEIFNTFNAKLIFVEKTNEGVSYYAYSKEIKYQKKVKGEKINLHVFISEGGTKIGSPLIFGSF